MTFPVSDDVAFAMQTHPERVRWLEREDGREELRLWGDGVVYNFELRSWVRAPHCCSIPDAWRLIGWPVSVAECLCMCCDACKNGVRS